MTLPAVFFVDDILPAPVWTTNHPRDKASDDTTIELEVDGIIKADGYRFYGSMTPGFTPGGGNLLISQASNSYDHTGLTGGDTWYYRVRAFNAHVEGLLGVEGSATVLPRVPGVPTLAVTAESVLQIDVLITAGTPDTADDYGLQRQSRVCGAPSFGAFSTIESSLAAGTYNDTSILEGSEYNYKARGQNIAGNSAYSAEDSGKASDTPGAPTGMAVVKGTPSTTVAEVSWTKSETGTNNDVEIHHSTTSAGAGFSLLDTQVYTDEDYSATGLADGVEHWFKTRQINDCGGEGSFSSVVSVVLDLAPPAGPPVDITIVPKNLTHEEMTSDHDGATGATDYDFYASLSTMGADPTVGGTQIVGATAPQDTDFESLLGAGPDDQVFLNVRGTNSGGNGPWGTEANGYTHVETPQNFDATQDFAGCDEVPDEFWFDLTWDDDNTDADQRNEARVIQRDDGAGFSTIHNTGATDKSHTDTGASASTVGYRIRYSSESVYATDTVTPECVE